MVEVASVPTALCSTRRYRSTNTRDTEVQKITTRMDECPPPLTNPRRRQKDNRPTGISGRITPRERRDQASQEPTNSTRKSAPSEDHVELVAEVAVVQLLAEPAYHPLSRTSIMPTTKNPFNNAHTVAQLAAKIVCCLKSGT